MLGHVVEIMVLMIINRKFKATKSFALLSNYEEDQGGTSLRHSPTSFDISIINHQLQPIYKIQLKTKLDQSKNDYDLSQIKLIYFNQDIGLRNEVDHFNGLYYDLIKYYDNDYQSTQAGKRLDERYRNLSKALVV